MLACHGAEQYPGHICEYFTFSEELADFLGVLDAIGTRCSDYCTRSLDHKPPDARPEIYVFHRARGPGVTTARSAATEGVHTLSATATGRSHDFPGKGAAVLQVRAWSLGQCSG